MASVPAVGVRISGSVGRSGANDRHDVLIIQQLLNAHLPVPLRQLKEDGNCGPVTISAIEEIQRRHLHMQTPDGKIDPNGATFRFLTGGTAPPAPHHHGHAAAAGGTFPPDVIAAAQASQKTTKIPASVTLAQWALESNWGRAMPSGSNNPFGIKAAAGQPFVEAKTREVVKGKDIYITAKFRKFSSIADAIEQHGNLLATARPYAHARTKIANPDDFADALTGVYATDPNYGTLLKRIMKSHNLYQYNQ